MSDVPRLIESKEVIGLAELVVMLTAPDQRYGVHSVRVPAYNWHEWGLYIGGGGLFVLVVGVLVCARSARALAEDPRPSVPAARFRRVSSERALDAPPRATVLRLAARAVAFSFSHAAPARRGIRGVRREPSSTTYRARRPWLDVAPARARWRSSRGTWRASRARPSSRPSGWRRPRTFAVRNSFEQRLSPPVQYVRRDWAAPILLAMFANKGVIQCYGFDPDFKPGAIARSDAGYRGLAWVAEGDGKARVVEWTPNRAVVEVTGAKPGAVVAYDMNYDSSWRADGEPALESRRRRRRATRPGLEPHRVQLLSPHARRVGGPRSRHPRRLLLETPIRSPRSAPGRGPSSVLRPFGADPGVRTGPDVRS